MSLAFWILGFGIHSAFAYWIVCKDGADRVEGWASFFVIGWFAPTWTADGIRLYVLLSWIFALIFFAIGLFYPALVAQA